MTAEGPAAEAVCVAVNIRPLVSAEIAEGCRPILHVTPGEPQVRKRPDSCAAASGWRQLGRRRCLGPWLLLAQPALARALPHTPCSNTKKFLAFTTGGPWRAPVHI